MKTIGILGGMSWESTRVYYESLNRGAAAHLGGSHSAACIIYSYDFAPIETMQHAGQWSELAALLAAGAQQLERAGAGILLLATNTMHVAAPQIEAALTIPFLHIADAAAAELLRAGCRQPALLAARFTMDATFYTERLARHGIAAMLPQEAERDIIHAIIYDELIHGITSEASRLTLASIVDTMISRGADGVLLACTELGLLLTQADSDVPLIDTTAAHVRAALDAALPPAD